MATRKTSPRRTPKPYYPACFNFGKYFKSTARTASTPYLPPELVEIIISRLPVKALLRFKSVSTWWNRTISNPAFIQNHHDISKSEEDLFLCQLESKELLRLVKLEDRKLQTVETQKSPNDGVRVLGACDGVILFSTLDHGHLLWDPFAGTETKFEIPYSLFPYHRGVCRDPAHVHNFKVVVANYHDYAVYSCENRSWSDLKQLNVATGPWSDFGVSVDGAIYWIIRPNNNNNNNNNNNSDYSEITYYDPRDDKFKILEKPKDVGDHKGIYIDVVDFGGSLCLYWYGTETHTIRIWTKENGIDKNRWEVLIIIYNVDMPTFFQPQCWYGNKIVFRSKAYYSLMVYSSLDNKFEQFEEGTRVYGPGLIPYMPFLPIENSRLRKPKGLHNIIEKPKSLHNIIIDLLRINSCF